MLLIIQPYLLNNITQFGGFYKEKQTKINNILPIDSNLHNTC